MIKVYSNKNIFASILVVVNGIQKRIEFKGGTYGGNQQTKSRFRTNNKSEQASIEAHRDFRAGLIQLEKEIPEEKDLVAQDIAAQAPKVVKLPDVEKQVKETPKEDPKKDVDASDDSVKQDDAKKETPKVDLKPDPNEGKDKSYPEATNTQHARKALKDFGVTLPAAANTATIIAEAKKLKLEFPAWEAYNKVD